MLKKSFLRLLAITLALMLLLSSCGDKNQPQNDKKNDKTNSSALTWNTWGGYDKFWELVGEKYPEIETEFVTYTGANQTGYSWARMRSDDITDLFTTSQVLDEGLVKERLLDLSEYDFINNISTAVLDNMAIDGGIYLLPINITVFGIVYNKTLMEEKGWELPNNFSELEALCEKIKAEGMIPGIVSTDLTGSTFSAVFNLAKTDWLTTPDGSAWEKNYLSGKATAKGFWEGTMDYVQKYIDIGMLTPDPDNRWYGNILNEYLAERKAVFFTSSTVIKNQTLENGDEIGIMPYIGESGEKNIYMYSNSSRIGISKRLAEPGNEEKLEKAIKILSLLYSPEGQEALGVGPDSHFLGVLNDADVSETSLIYDAQLAMRDGRAFMMTYANWDHILSDIGQAYKDWFRGENDMDGEKCIARMDELQSDYLENLDGVYFCESTDDFTLEQTARLMGRVLMDTSETDAAMLSYSTLYKKGVSLGSSINAKLYKGRINADVSTTIVPKSQSSYAVLTMTGAQAKALAETGFDITVPVQLSPEATEAEIAAAEAEAEHVILPYTLVTKDGEALNDDETYRIVFLTNGYTAEAAETYNAEITDVKIGDILREWLTAQKTVSPEK